MCRVEINYIVLISYGIKYQYVYIVCTQVNVNPNLTYVIYSFNLGLFFSK
jgi:hypothetical protein